jgi:hypothetical protein
MSELPHHPRLVVLASCQSGGSSHDGGALTALGPRLAEIGVPAVLAMQRCLRIHQPSLCLGDRAAQFTGGVEPLRDNLVFHNNITHLLDGQAIPSILPPYASGQPGISPSISPISRRVSRSATTMRI